MPICLIIAKQIKLRLAISRLKLAKLNAYRASLKLPPKYTWYGQLGRWIWGGFRGLVLYTLCWCLVCKCGKEKRSKWDTLWTDGTLANTIMKSFFGLFVGLFFTHFITLFLIFQLNFEPVTTTYTCFAFGLVLILGLSFSQTTRCFMFLTVPQFFTKKGRAAILAYCFILAMSGPGKNITTNMEILTESLICGQEMAHNATQGLIDLVKDPLSALGATFRRMKDAIIDVATQMTNGVGALIRAIIAVVNVIKAAFKWLKKITSICNKKLGTPFERCIGVFDTAIKDCEEQLGVMKWMCSIVSVVQYLCHVARIVDLLCWLPSLIKEAIFAPIKQQLKKVTDAIKTFFDVRLNFTDFYQMKHSFNSSKSFHQVVQGMKSEIMDQVHWFLQYMDWVDLLISMFMFLAFYKALIYRYRFQHSERSDNFYITKELVRLDLTRRRLGKETIFPLKYRESYTYIQTFSLVLLEAEQKALQFQLMIVTFAAIKICVIILIDYGFYRFLLLVKKHGAVHVDTGEMLGYNVQVQGEGFMADMYRAILFALSPIGDLLPVFDTTPCLPIPLIPNYYEYGMIFFLLGVCYFACITQPYFMRLRHIICEIYYPDRKLPRARWLYSHILSARGLFLMYARSQLKGKMEGKGGATYKVGLLDRLSHTIPGFRKLMFFIGAVKKKCFLCGKAGEMDNMEDFVHCPSCDSIYCNDCYEEIEFRCIACMSPIEFGDVSEESGSHTSDSDPDDKKISKRKSSSGATTKEARKESDAKRKKSDTKDIRMASESEQRNKPKYDGDTERGSSESSSSDEGPAITADDTDTKRVKFDTENQETSQKDSSANELDLKPGPTRKSLSTGKILTRQTTVESKEMSESVSLLKDKQDSEYETDEAESSESSSSMEAATQHKKPLQGSKRKPNLKPSGNPSEQNAESEHSPIENTRRKGKPPVTSDSDNATESSSNESHSTAENRTNTKSKATVGRQQISKKIKHVVKSPRQKNKSHRSTQGRHQTKSYPQGNGTDSDRGSVSSVQLSRGQKLFKQRKRGRSRLDSRNSTDLNGTQRGRSRLHSRNSTDLNGTSSSSSSGDRDLISFENEIPSRHSRINASKRRTVSRFLPTSGNDPDSNSSSDQDNDEGSRDMGRSHFDSRGKSRHKKHTKSESYVQFADDANEAPDDEDPEHRDLDDDNLDDADGTCHHHQAVDEDVYDKYSEVISELTDTFEGSEENSGEENSGEENSGEENSGEETSGDENSGEETSGDENSGDKNSGEETSGDENSDEENSDKESSGEEKSGKENSGKENSGEENSGEENSDEENSDDENSDDENSDEEKSGEEDSDLKSEEVPKRIDPHACTRRRCSAAVPHDLQGDPKSRANRVKEWVHTTADSSTRHARTPHYAADSSTRHAKTPHSAAASSARRAKTPHSSAASSARHTRTPHPTATSNVRPTRTLHPGILERVAKLDKYYTAQPYPPHMNVHKPRGNNF